jgi:hypothetical protein
MKLHLLRIVRKEACELLIVDIELMPDARSATLLVFRIGPIFEMALGVLLTLESYNQYIALS